MIFIHESMNIIQTAFHKRSIKYREYIANSLVKLRNSGKNNITDYNCRMEESKNLGVGKSIEEKGSILNQEIVVPIYHLYLMVGIIILLSLQNFTTKV